MTSTSVMTLLSASRVKLEKFEGIVLGFGTPLMGEVSTETHVYLAEEAANDLLRQLETILRQKE